tara:strand:+ start:146 stop:253 length:108 start_codon:yes stop_codon:yes gene_type:complete
VVQQVQQQTLVVVELVVIDFQMEQRLVVIQQDPLL